MTTRGHRRASRHQITNLTLKVWRQEGPDDRGHFETLQRRRDQRRGLVPGDARRAQRAADRRGQGRDRVRPRLPRGHLRHVLADDRRRRPTARSGARRRASCTCASSTERREIVVEPWRATAFPIIKDLMVDRAAFDRIIEAGGFITAADRRRARRQPDPDPQAGRRRGDGRRRVHRLRGVRRGLPERRGQPVHRGQDHPPQPAARRARPSATPAPRRWSRRWTTYFGSCTNHGECEAACPKSISIDVIALMNADYLKSKFKNRKRIDRT